MEAKTEAQEERIVALEEEVATLRWKKACSCGEEGKETVIATGSGEDDASELEYVEEEEVSSGSSYHSPIVASEAPLLVFGSPAEGPAPILLPSSCACPVPAVIHIEDDVEMTAVPRENNTPIPVHTGGKRLWKPVFTCWVHFSLWQKVLPMLPPDTFHSHFKCNCNMCLQCDWQ